MASTQFDAIAAGGAYSEFIAAAYMAPGRPRAVVLESRHKTGGEWCS
jgi:ribulose 1,5-bisphosphate synthetase/thiazole synthase